MNAEKYIAEAEMSPNAWKDGNTVDVAASNNECIPAWDAAGDNFGVKLRRGFLKCRDDPVPPTMIQAPTLVYVAPPPVCDPQLRQNKLVGHGSWTCNEKTVRKGEESYFKCQVSCSDGKNHKGPRFTRCKTFDYKTKRGDERKRGVWYTNKNKKMTCSKNPMEANPMVVKK